MIVFYFISRYLFDNVCPILLFKPYDMMPYSHLPSHVYLFCILTHGCTCPPILLLLKYFTPYYFNNFTLSILPLFTLQIYTIFLYSKKRLSFFIAFVLFPTHSQLLIERNQSFSASFVFTLCRPLSVRYPIVFRSTIG